VLRASADVVVSELGPLVVNAEPPKLLTVWDKLAAGLAASEMKPITREDARRAKENQGK
jgi:hypothetical protein